MRKNILFYPSPSANDLGGVEIGLGTGSLGQGAR